MTRLVRSSGRSSTSTTRSPAPLSAPRCQNMLVARRSTTSLAACGPACISTADSWSSHSFSPSISIGPSSSCWRTSSRSSYEALPGRPRGPPVSVARLLADKRVCVCGGSGGVGKTTISAAIALGMAAEGAKVAVVTIDPAKRLANALGLRELDNEPRRVAPEMLRTNGARVAGELWAMMLDPKRTFDELIDRVAPDASRAREIKANRIYGELSTAVSGSQEFTAIAKLYELDQEQDFDLLVLDTPPSRNALDFLYAPWRLTAFLDGRALKTFSKPTGLGMRTFGRGAAPLLGVLRRITGVDLLSDLSSFFGLL